MDFVLLFMMSEPDFLSAVSTYAFSERGDANNRLLLANSSNTISRMQYSYAIDKNFYRISLFDAQGVFFSSHYRGDIRPPQPMPKMVLQPFAENAFRHGFQETGGWMRILIEGAISDGQFQLWMDDNGVGFSDEVLGTLKERMAPVPAGILPPEDGLSIGDMGLINTYARLRTYYGDVFSMEITNLPPGACILIRVPMKEEGNP